MRLTLALAISRSSYWKAAVLGVCILISVLAFWFGLGFVLRTNSPLIPVDSTGMQPNLNFGDLALIQGVTNASEINVLPLNGDILVFRKPSEPGIIVIRRAVDKTSQYGVWYFRTQADLNVSPDPWGSGQNPEDTWGDGFFHQKFLIGKVVGKIPYLGYLPLCVAELVRNPAAMFLLVALVFLVILIWHSSLLKKAKALSTL